MTTKFNMTRDINGYNGFGLPASDTNYSATLAISTDTSLTVPTVFALGDSSSTSKAKLIAIIVPDPGSSVWVALNTAASAPAGASFAATASFLNPAALEVKGGDVIHFFCTTANVSVSVRFYWITS